MLKNITFGGYDVGRSVEAPMDIVIFLSPFFLAVNFMALVIRLTKTDKISMISEMLCFLFTLLHSVDICNDMIDFMVVI